MKPIHLVMAAAMAVLLSACWGPSSTKPVGTPSPDLRLAGTWIGAPFESKGNAIYYHGLPQTDGSYMMLMVESNNREVGRDWYYFTFTTAKIGKFTFMNLLPVLEKGKPAGDVQGTMPALYSFDAKGQLTVAMLDRNAVNAAITAGKVKGKVGGGYSEDPILEAGPALDAFLISKEGLALFSRKVPAILRRVK